MPQEDDEAAEVHHGEEVVQPSKEAFDLPAAPVPAKGPAVLRLRFPAVAPVGGNQFHAVTPAEALVKAVAIIGAVADYLLRLRAEEPLRANLRRLSATVE